MQLSLTEKRQNWLLYILHLSHEGKIEKLHGKVEPNSTYITFKISNLCHIAVIGLDKLNQSFCVSFFRKRNYNGNIKPLLKILTVIYPFEKNKVSYLRVFVFF